MQRQVQCHAADLVLAPAGSMPQAGGANSGEHIGVADDLDHRQGSIGQQHRKARTFDKLVQIFHIWPR